MRAPGARGTRWHGSDAAAVRRGGGGRGKYIHRTQTAVLPGCLFGYVRGWHTYLVVLIYFFIFPLFVSSALEIDESERTRSYIHETNASAMTCVRVGTTYPSAGRKHNIEYRKTRKRKIRPPRWAHSGTRRWLCCLHIFHTYTIHFGRF